MSERFRLDSEIDFQNKFYTKCNNIIVDSVGPRSIFTSRVEIVLIQIRRLCQK